MKEQEHINHKLIAQPLIAHSQPQGHPKAAPNPKGKGATERERGKGDGEREAG